MARSFVEARGRSAPWMVIFLAGLPGCISGDSTDLESCWFPRGSPFGLVRVVPPLFGRFPVSAFLLQD